MKIASFVRNGEFDCGLVDARGEIHILDECPELNGIPRPRRIFKLLGLPPAERRNISARNDFQKYPVINPPALAPALPLCPLYFLAHGNSPTIWKRQLGIKFRWNIPRLPVFRVRPWTSFSGHNHLMELPQEAALSHGTEVGIVLGRDAFQIPEKQAADYIAGLVVLNDLYTNGLLGEYEKNPASSYHTMARDGLRKAADGNGAMGPWVTTVEELEDSFASKIKNDRARVMREKSHALACLYDLLTLTRSNGNITDRSHTSSILHGAEYLIAYLSRFMTLPAGAVLGLGAAGWDGQECNVGPRAGDKGSCEVEIENAGAMLTGVVRASPHAARQQSPFAAERQKLGLDPAAIHDRPGRSLWICQGNCKTNTAEASSLNPFLYPPRVLGADNAPVTLHPGMGRIQCEVHLAGVIGRAVYNLKQAEAPEAFEGLTVMLSLRFMGLTEAIDAPFDYEYRGAWFLGGCADGFARIGAIISPGKIKHWRNLKMTVGLENGPKVETSAADYCYGPDELAIMCSRQTTLLPGDVLSLGPAGGELTLPPESNCDSKRIYAEIENIGRVEALLHDRRVAKPADSGPDWLDARYNYMKGWA